MFGLTQLEHALQPKSTLDKLLFLIENAFSHAHRLTTVISFGALVILVAMRTFKQACQRYWFIYRLPEVFIVVVVSTSKCATMYRFVLADRRAAVLSDNFDWDQDGVEILGSVPINTGSSFIQFPLSKMTLRYLRKTTPTAMYVLTVASSAHKNTDVRSCVASSP